jgi:transposase-like protein
VGDDVSGRRFAPETIAEAVGALESGVPAPVVCRRFGVSDRTLYRWRRASRG